MALPYDGPPVLARPYRAPAHPPVGRTASSRWPRVDPARWGTSLDRPAFEAGVHAIRAEVARGGVYQVNLTRRLSAPLIAVVARPG